MCLRCLFFVRFFKVCLWFLWLVFFSLFFLEWREGRAFVGRTKRRKLTGLFFGGGQEFFYGV